jgi:hypothetical protein
MFDFDVYVSIDSPLAKNSLSLIYIWMVHKDYNFFIKKIGSESSMRRLKSMRWQQQDNIISIIIYHKMTSILTWANSALLFHMGA